MNGEDNIGRVSSRIIELLIGVIVVTSIFIPIVLNLTNGDEPVYPLIRVLPLLVIIGLIITALGHKILSSKDDYDNY